MVHFRYALSLMHYAFSLNKLLYVSIFISLVSVGIELAAVSSLIPLFAIITGGSSSKQDIIVIALNYLGVAASSINLLWVFVILFGFRILTQLLGQALTIYLGRQVLAQLSSESFKRVMSYISIRDITKNSIGFYISLAGDEANRASGMVIAVVQFASVVTLAFLYFVAIAKFSLITAFLIGIFLLLSSGVLYWIAKISHRMGARQILDARSASSMFLDALNNLKTVRALSAETYVVGMYRSKIFDYSRSYFITDLISIATRLIPVLLLLIVFSIWLVLHSGAVDVGVLTFIITLTVYLTRFFPTVGQGVNLLLRIASDARSGRDVTKMIQSMPASQVDRGKHISLIQSIDLHDVGFRYDENSGKTVLHSIDFKLVKGNSYALIGRSGIGKSTLVDILLKFYDPTSGQIYFNADIATELSEADIRKKVILVSQEAAIFDDTVMHNICLGREANVVDVQRVCELACIHDVIQAMPNGYMTRLQYQGSNLSGGQRQRIAIARALLRNPDVLILDESTSALDKQTQQRVFENILHEFKDKIVIFVTHDPQIINKVSETIDLGEINKIPSE